MVKRIGFVWIALMSAGCPMKPVYVDELDVAVPRPFVPTKSTMPCYVLLEGVPDDVVTQRGSTKRLRIHRLRAFVERDLRLLLETWFATVEVTTGPVPAGEHVEVRVGFAAFGSQTTAGSGAPVVETAVGQPPVVSSVPISNSQGWLDWSVTIYVPGDELALFSMTDRAPGGAVIQWVFQSGQLVDGILESALLRLAQAYDASGAQGRVLERERAWRATGESAGPVAEVSVASEGPSLAPSDSAPAPVEIEARDASGAMRKIRSLSTSFVIGTVDRQLAIELRSAPGGGDREILVLPPDGDLAGDLEATRKRVGASCAWLAHRTDGRVIARSIGPCSAVQ